MLVEEVGCLLHRHTSSHAALMPHSCPVCMECMEWSGGGETRHAVATGSACPLCSSSSHLSGAFELAMLTLVRVDRKELLVECTSKPAVINGGSRVSNPAHRARARPHSLRMCAHAVCCVLWGVCSKHPRLVTQPVEVPPPQVHTHHQR